MSRYPSVKGQITRRLALFAGGAAVGGYLGTKVANKVPSIAGTKSLRPAGAPDTLNDASLLSETPVYRHTVVKEEPGELLYQRIRDEMGQADLVSRPFNIGAARHSMGGHAIPPEGHAVTFDNDKVQPILAEGIYRVHPGARWSEVIRRLDAIGMSPKIMQSNNDFGVAATFCVNAHGWPVSYGPMGSSVQEFEIVRPDGELVRASRFENSEIFEMTMGGYGLTGAIVDMKVEMVPNKRLVPTFQKMSTKDFAQFFVGALDAGDVEMAYGRLNVDRETFFEDALMITYRAASNQEDLPRATGSGAVSHASARVFRAQLHNEPIKDLRWWFETSLGPSVAGGEVTRNSLLNEPVVTLDDRDPNRTDILHEYFVPPGRFPDFVAACQEIIPSSYQELLNITLRYVLADRESVLPYASGNRIACVMLFSQELTERAEIDHQRVTQALIDRVLDMGGNYYLPYRPHATRDQFLKAYPRAPEFAARKMELDPKKLFRNAFWDNYLEGLA